MSILCGHAQLGVGVHKSIDIILHLVVVVVIIVNRTLVGTVTILVNEDDTIGESEIIGTGAGFVALGIRMQILGTAHLGRYFTKPAAVVQLSAIDLDEIDVVKIGRTSILINGPINHEAGFLAVGEIIHIALAEERLEPIVAIAVAHVNGRIGQFGTTEGQHSVLNPQGPIGLGVEGVAPNVAAGAIGIHVIAGPADVLHITDETPAGMRHTFFVFVWLIIGHLKTGLTAVIVTSLDFIPLVAVTGYTVAVHVHAHHDDARLAAAASHVGYSSTLHGVTIDFHVITVLVDHGVVKAEYDVAAIAAQADRATQSAAKGHLELGIDAVLGISRLIGREYIDKLAWSRHVVIDMGNVWRIAGACRQCRHSG